MQWCKSSREFNREIETLDVFTTLKAIIETQELIMAAIDDLTTAVTSAVSSMGAALDAINALRQQLAGGNGVTDAQLEGLASQLTSSTDSLNGVVNAASTGAAPTPGASNAGAAPATDTPAATS